MSLMISSTLTSLVPLVICSTILLMSATVTTTMRTSRFVRRFTSSTRKTLVGSAIPTTSTFCGEALACDMGGSPVIPPATSSIRSGSTCCLRMKSGGSRLNAASSTVALSGVSNGKFSVSASAERICASLAAFIVTRICARLLPGVCPWTFFAWSNWSWFTCPRSRRSCSTDRRDCVFVGVQIASGSNPRSSAASGASAGGLVATALSELGRFPNITFASATRPGGRLSSRSRSWG